MTFDSSFQGKVWGNTPNAYPAMSGALHVKYVNSPMTPGVMVRAFEVDPFGADVNGVINGRSLNVTPATAQNIILTSGSTLPGGNPEQYFNTYSQHSFTQPRVVTEFAIAGSGLPGTLGDAYPAQVNNGLVNGGTYPNPNGF